MNNVPFQIHRLLSVRSSLYSITIQKRCHLTKTSTKNSLSKKDKSSKSVPILESLRNESRVFQVYGDQDADGFYLGRTDDGRTGYVPSNMVSEITETEQKSPISLIKRTPTDSKKISPQVDYSDDTSHIPKDESSSEEKNSKETDQPAEENKVRKPDKFFTVMGYLFFYYFLLINSEHLFESRWWDYLLDVNLFVFSRSHHHQ